MFANVQSGELVLSKELAERFGYSRLVLTGDQVEMLTRCFEKRRTRFGDASIGKFWEGVLYVVCVDGTTSTVGFGLEIWASRVMKSRGVWAVSPEIVRVLEEIGRGSPAGSDRVK
ncbi:MAG TPA: hypothetical protein PJ982_18735 [Lacipirellulaceae bacterium]|nr:hypothetical protein [Lacipirellulaceae bacterium]